eukprot:4691123-Prymnesium_polylepis.1
MLQPRKALYVGAAASIPAAPCSDPACDVSPRATTAQSKSMPSLWLRNIQLAIYSTVIASIGILLQADPSLREKGVLHGEATPYTPYTPP